MAQTLDAFFSAHDWPELVAASRWTVKRDEKNPALVRLHVVAKDQEGYDVALWCDGYSATAPSVAFVNEDCSKADPRAWPKGAPEVVKPPPHSFLCMPLTREGLTHHPEWRNDVTADPWDGDRHSLLDLFNYVQRLLNGASYQGRGP